MKIWVMGFTLCLGCVLNAANIAVIGVGKVGLCLALALEQKGHNVLGVDVSAKYVDLLNRKELISPEPGVMDLLKTSQNFRATTSLKEGMEFSRLCFVLVPTAIGEEGYCLDIMTELLQNIASMQLSNKHIVICSTVLPGYNRNVVKELFKDQSGVAVSYTPPFIAQGSILNNFFYPDMVLLGVDSASAADELKDIYRVICDNHPYFAQMSVASAEIAKLALNSFVTAKIAFANLVGDIADKTYGADKYAIMKAIGQDSRIGAKYFTPGYGFGGPCFTRDNRALAQYCDTIDMESTIFSTTDYANEQHAQFMAKQFIEQGLEEYVFEDISYKSNCPVKIIENSQKLRVAELVAKEGKRVVVVEQPDVIQLVREKFGDLFTYIAL